jgi:hypothetical protein
MSARALLVGLNTYPDPRNNLNSCVADTLAFKAMLCDTYGFDPSYIQLLHNQDATLDNVRAGLDSLFAGAQAGDTLVFFESSHGYRYPEGDTMVEVLCLYDQFFKDTELSERTQALPPNVLTVVLDACHSGGMNKLFFPPGSVQVARAKVWQPTPVESERDAQLYAQVSKFKFFGRSTTGDSGAVAKNLIFNPQGVPAPKALDESAVDLNGALFAACLADQTAAAGSPPTNNLSAFTYGVVQEARAGISLSQISDRVHARLSQLNMSQTPIAIAPPMHQELLTDSFISLGAASTGGPISGGIGGTVAGGIGFDADAWLRQQLAGVGR